MLTVLLVAKDEEENLKKFWGNIPKRNKIEFLLYDTGSTDKTKEVAEKFGFRVLEGSWDEDESQVWNQAASQATYDWIFTPDADELVVGDWDKILETLENNYAQIWYYWFFHNDGETFLQNKFYHRKYFYWMGTIFRTLVGLRKHEYTAKVFPRDVLYLEHHPDERKVHRAGYLEKALKEYNESRDPRYAFYLTKIYYKQGNILEAKKYAKKLVQTASEPYLKSYGYILLGHIESRPSRKLAYYHLSASFYPHWREPFWNIAMVHRYLKDFQAACFYLKAMMEIKPPATFWPFDRYLYDNRSINKILVDCLYRMNLTEEAQKKLMEDI